MNDNEKNNYVTLSVDIPYDIKDKLKFLSYKEKRPIKDIVKEALEKFLAEQAET